MWDVDGMYKKIHSKTANDISEEEYRELYKQPGAQVVVEAVRQYNELVSQLRHFEDKDVNALLIKKAEEEEAKIFLDGLFDITQNRN
jgi:hypothetical protein